MRLLYDELAPWPTLRLPVDYNNHQFTTNWAASANTPKLSYFEIQSRHPGRAGFVLELSDHEARRIAKDLNNALAHTKGPEPCPTPSSANTPDVLSHAKFEPQPPASKQEPTSKRPSRKSSRRSTRP